ncbi:MAG: fluoride efflux transporter CrcB [Paracoccaceae bacterium]
MIWTLSQIAAGGAIGAVLRHASVLAVMRVTGPGFPMGTLVVNIAGSLAMGFLFVMLAARGGVLSPFLMTGVLGGFTTFSAFSLDAVILWQRGEVMQALFYIAASVVLSLTALIIGAMLARSMT